MIQLKKIIFTTLAGVVLCATSLLSYAETTRYGVFDGYTYSPNKLEIAANSPVQLERPKFEKGAYFVQRASDGHYYIAGSVNGFPIVFLVDSGASYTTIPIEMAKNAGIRAGKQIRSSTANGDVEMHLSGGNIVGIGPFSVKGRTVAVADRLRVALLGMDILNKLQVAYSNGFMVIKVPS